VLTTFVDSACKDVCPIIVGTLGRALRQLTPQERAQFVALAISVHPLVDTPAYVRRFLTQHGALGELEYLVAPVARMKSVWLSFHVLSAAATHNADLHSADVRIFDKNGVWVSNMNVGADLSIANVLHDIRQAMKTRAA
jgi:cytochrome oxidase Cu insertion factor (SCO1/SenC/PrrC family)